MQIMSGFAEVGAKGGISTSERAVSGRIKAGVEEWGPPGPFG